MAEPQLLGYKPSGENQDHSHNPNASDSHPPPPSYDNAIQGKSSDESTSYAGASERVVTQSDIVMKSNGSTDNLNGSTGGHKTVISVSDIEGNRGKEQDQALHLEKPASQNSGVFVNKEKSQKNGSKDRNGAHKMSIPGRVTPADVTNLEMDQMNGKAATRNGPDKMPDKGGNNGDGKSDDEEKKKDEPQKVVGFFEVFKYADKLDVFLILLGTLCAACHGAALPGMIIVFGQMIDLFVSSGRFQNVIDGIEGCGLMGTLNTTSEALLKDPSILLDSGIQSIIINANCTNFNFVQELTNVNDAVTRDLLDTMREYAIYFTIIGCGVIVLGYGQVTFWMIASERQTHRIRQKFFNNILRQNIGWFDVHESGELTTRLSDDINKIHDGIGDKCGGFFQWFCGFLSGFIIGFIWGWKLTLVILAISPLLAGSAFVMTKLVALASASELKAYAKAGAIAEEVIGAVRTVVAFGGQEKECQRYNIHLVEARDLGIRKGLVNGFTMGLVWFVIFGAYALGFWYGAKLTREEADVYSIGDVMIVFFAVLIGAFSLGNAAPNVQSFGVARGAAYTIYSLIELNPPIDSFSKDGKQPDSLNGNIEFRNIHFKYPSRPDVQVLNGVNLKVNRGQIVALVGSSGCGKSTIVQLIQRFYDPENGNIYIDGTDLKDLNLKWLREHIGIVSQEPVLFGTTIAENIRYGREDATKEDIENAARMANAHDFIMKLPDKYETLVGERGAQLSGGQKQRVAIARALIRDPKILLLDEATSALDTESEGIVQDALEKASNGRTTIVIAHRLSTIKNADLIAGFKDGVIAEMGTHNELMAKDGIYNKLVTQQTQMGDDEEEVEIEEYEKAKPELKRLKSQIDGTPIKRVTSIKKGASVEGESAEEKDKEKKKEVDASLKRILRINAAEWPFILLGCLGSLINGGVMPAFAIIFAEIIGVFSESDPEKQRQDIMMYCLIFVGIGAISLVAMFLQGYMFGRSGEYLTLRLRQMSFRAILRQEISYFDDHDNSVGALTTRLATDASQVQGAAGIKLGSTIMSICSLLTGIIIAFIYGWKLTLVILCFVPALAVAGALQMKMLTGAAGKNREALEVAGKVAVESIENIRTVASLTREKVFFDNYLRELSIPYNAALKKAHIIGLTFSISQAIVFFAYAASFYYGAVLIEDGEMEYVDVFKVFSAIVFSAMAIGEASSFAPNAAKAQTSAEKIFELLDTVPAIDSYSTEGVKPNENQITSRVTFSHVDFRYPTRPDVQVLKGLNVSVEPGTTVALVGSSGCGKSTTVQLIERFYDAESGEVCMDKHNIKDLNLQWLRSQIGIVSQEPVLFDRSIAENIAYGDNSREVSMDEIIKAARNSNIHEFISSLPEGYETNVGEKGAQLSGGQKQRVAIARALVRNPKILLLDEATSALDTESEKVVQEALDKAREGRTSIVIAHRLSTIQNADKICVIRHGIVTEEGKHNDLMKNQGFYYKLNMAQARKK